MATTLAKIADIEAEMARTQKNKATAGHLGLLKAKLAKLRREILEPKVRTLLTHSLARSLAHSLTHSLTLLSLRRHES